MPNDRLERTRRAYEGYVYDPPREEGFVLPSVPPLPERKCLCHPMAHGFVCVYCQARAS